MFESVMVRNWPARTARAAPLLVVGVGAGVSQTGGDQAVTAQWSAAQPYASQIGCLAARYNLTPREVIRLRVVLADYDPVDHAAELAEEVRCIMAARKLAAMPELTAEAVDRAREAVEAGRTSFVPQDVD